MPDGRAGRWLGRLQADLASGRPVLYRRVPGTRHYVNPKNRVEVTEHYVIRVYRPALDERQRDEIRRKARQYGATQAKRRWSLARTYGAKHGMTATQAARSAGFQRAMSRLRELQYEARDISQRLDTRPGSEYADLLVELGRRMETDEHDVGMSPEGWIDTHVLPALTGES